MGTIKGTLAYWKKFLYKVLAMVKHLGRGQRIFFNDLDRPNSNFRHGKYAQMDNLCFAEFLSNYYIQPKFRLSTNSHYQPVV